MNDANTGSLDLDAVTPALTVGNLEASLDYYSKVLGFAVEERFPDPDGEIVGAVVRAGKAALLLGQDDWAQGRDRPKGVGFRLYCPTHQNVDELAAAIKARGGELAQEPTDQPWGARDFSVVDPDGFKISISTPMTV